MAVRVGMLRWAAALIAGTVGAAIGWLTGDVLVAAIVRGDLDDSALGVILMVGATLVGAATGAIVGLASVGAILSGGESS